MADGPQRRLPHEHVQGGKHHRCSHSCFQIVKGLNEHLTHAFLVFTFAELKGRKAKGASIHPLPGLLPLQ